jgi:hypothetical protein
MQWEKKKYIKLVLSGFFFFLNESANWVFLFKSQAAKIKLTYIICGKRHHFKFGPTTDKKNECSHNGNLLPGVVIDTVSDPNSNFLQSKINPSHFWSAFKFRILFTHLTLIGMG